MALRCCFLWGLLLAPALPGWAQAPPAARCDYPQPVPYVPGHPARGLAYLNELLNRELLRYPPQARRARVRGTVYLSVLIDSAGRVQTVRVRQGLGHGCTAAAVAAAWRLPRLVPACEHLKRVPMWVGFEVRFPWRPTPAGPPANTVTLVACNLGDGSPRDEFFDPDIGALLPDSILRPRLYATEMPHLPGGTLPGLYAWLSQQAWCDYGGPGSGTVYVRFVVGPRGGVYGGALVQSRVAPPYAAALNAAALRAVQRLPRLVPGREGGRPVAVAITAAVEVCARR